MMTLNQRRSWIVGNCELGDGTITYVCFLWTRYLKKGAAPSTSEEPYVFYQLLVMPPSKAAAGQS
eukprot:8878218-Pyramimonas_sp.AAC.1